MPSLMRTSAKDLTNLPLIDVESLRMSDPGKFKATANEIGRAAQETGFFRIFNHGIAPVLIDTTYEMAARFFALPYAAKKKYYIGLSSNHRGYVPFNEKGDYPDELHRSYEAFDFGSRFASRRPGLSGRQSGSRAKRLAGVGRLQRDDCSILSRNIDAWPFDLFSARVAPWLADWGHDRSNE